MQHGKMMECKRYTGFFDGCILAGHFHYRTQVIKATYCSCR